MSFIDNYGEWPDVEIREAFGEDDEPEEEEPAHYCYMGHLDCWDEHWAERRADEADWEEDMRREGL